MDLASSYDLARELIDGTGWWPKYGRMYELFMFSDWLSSSQKAFYGGHSYWVERKELVSLVAREIRNQYDIKGYLERDYGDEHCSEKDKS